MFATTSGSYLQEMASVPAHTNIHSPSTESPEIVLPDDYTDGSNTCFTKRQRVSCDGRYSPCPSSNGSVPHSPYSDLGDFETSAPSTPYPAQLSLRCPSFLQPTLAVPEPPETTKKPTDSKYILNSLIVDLSSVFSTRTPKELDRELCFGMILGKVISTCQELCLLQQSYTTAARTASTPLSFVPLQLKFSLPLNGEVQVSTEIGPKNLVLGTLEKSLSMALSPLLTSHLVRMQALALPPFTDNSERRKAPQTSSQRLEITINIYGEKKNTAHIGRFLSKNNIYLQHPIYPEPGHIYKNPHFLTKPGVLTLITESTFTGGIGPIKATKENPEAKASIGTTELSRIFDGLWDSRTLEEQDGDWRLKTTLLRHQKQGLYFLTRRESGLSIFKHQDQLNQSHCSVRGGILADYMGLGKTLTILSLVVGSLEKARSAVIAPQQYLDSRKTTILLGTTLLIAPVSILGNWEAQIAAHIQPNTLKCYIYYGKDRAADPRVLSNFDIVLTSFQTVTQEWKAAQNSSPAGPLYSINWFRLILDEAHVIRTRKTLKCQAICALSAQRRWCVTGTPLQNNITDIATLFKFLRYEPLNTTANFDREIVSKLKAGDDAGMETLRAMLQPVCLRRTKDIISDKLPARVEEMKYLEFNMNERILYDEYRQKLSSGWDLARHTTSINTLQVLLDLRLICNHGKDLLEQRQLPFVCSKCRAQLRDWKMTFEDQIPCVHRALCQSCMYNLEEADENEIGNDLDLGCQLCFDNQRTLGNSMWSAFPNYQGPSTKVRALTTSIHQTHSNDIKTSVYPWSKHVVFSSWTRMLDLVQIALKTDGISFCRLDGSMSRSQRDQTLDEFTKNPGITVILVSIMAGGFGINLTCASRVHLLEPHWNPMVEQQAVERVHRLGQTRDAVITRYIMKNSFEIDMLNIQKRKLELAKQSLDSRIIISNSEDVDMV